MNNNEGQKPKKKMFKKGIPNHDHLTLEEWNRLNKEMFNEEDWGDIIESEDDSDETEELNFDR